MSKIIATDHFETQNWEVSFEDLSHNYADLFIGFTDESPVVEFKDLRFGYELRQGENIKKYDMYPPSGVKYVNTDQEYLVSQRLKLEPEQTYTLFLWAENDGQRFEKEFEFATPRPSQPYPSWAWNSENKVWEAPVPRPDDGKFYQWDEETQNWIEEVEEP